MFDEIGLKMIFSWCKTKIQGTNQMLFAQKKQKSIGGGLVSSIRQD